MRTFVMLSNLTGGGTRTVKEHPERIAQVNREVQSMGGKNLVSILPPGPLRLPDYTSGGGREDHVPDRH
jgi:hypothetical protein